MNPVQYFLKRFSNERASPRNNINDKLVLDFPDEEDWFPLGLEGGENNSYVGDRWSAILDGEGRVCGSTYWAKKGNNFESHSHDFKEYGYIFSGSCVLYVQNQAPRLLVTGDNYMIPKGVFHEVSWIDDTVLVLRWEPPLNGIWSFTKDISLD